MGFVAKGEDSLVSIAVGSIVKFSSKTGTSSIGGKGLDSKGTVQIESDVAISGPVKSTKLFAAAKGSTISIDDGAGTATFAGEGLTNSGTVTFGKVAVVADNYVQKEGATTMGGTTIKMNGNPMKIEGGSVDGAAGTLEGEVKLSGMAGLSPGTAQSAKSRRRLANSDLYGTLTVKGNMEMSSGATNIDVHPSGSKDRITGAGEEVEVVYGSETVTVKTCYTTKAPTKAPTKAKATTTAPTKAPTTAPSKKPTNKLRISAGVSVGSGVSKLVLVTIACMLSVSWLTAM